jgi:hypothetical protein
MCSSSGRVRVASRAEAARPSGVIGAGRGAGSVEEQTGDRGGHVLLAERRDGREHADDQADERLGQRAPAMSSRMSRRPGPLEEPPQRLVERAVEALGVGSTPPRARSTKGPRRRRARARAGDALLGRGTASIRADASRAPTSRRRLARARPAGSPVREVAVDRGPRDPGAPSATSFMLACSP